LLRSAVSDLLPPSVKRRKKLGFNPPVGIWLNGPLRPMLEETLSPKRIRAEGIFQSDAVERLKAEHRSGHRDRSLHLYALLNFQVWSQRPRTAVAGGPLRIHNVAGSAS
jgi:asparagine synthase (glutamine-hydrolysing)